MKVSIYTYILNVKVLQPSHESNSFCIYVSGTIDRQCWQGGPRSGRWCQVGDIDFGKNWDQLQTLLLGVDIDIDIGKMDRIWRSLKRFVWKKYNWHWNCEKGNILQIACVGCCVSDAPRLTLCWKTVQQQQNCAPRVILERVKSWDVKVFPDIFSQGMHCLFEVKSLTMLWTMTTETASHT